MLVKENVLPKKVLFINKGIRVKIKKTSTCSMLSGISDFGISLKSTYMINHRRVATIIPIIVHKINTNDKSGRKFMNRR